MLISKLLPRFTGTPALLTFGGEQDARGAAGVQFVDDERARIAAAARDDHALIPLERGAVGLGGIKNLRVHLLPSSVAEPRGCQLVTLPGEIHR